MAEALAIAAALERLARGTAPAEPLADAEEDAVQTRRAERRARRSISLNLTPMIDVSLFLLVFFVAATRTLDREEFLRSDLSQHGTAAAAPASLSLDEPPLRIELLREDGKTRIHVLAPMSQPESFDQLSSIFHAKRYSKDNPGGLFPADQPIELAPGKDVRWDDAVAAFNALVRAGYQQIHFAGAP